MALTLTDLQKLHRDGEKIAMLSCYDASLGALCDEAGIEILLVGDSLGMVVQGRTSTIPVTLDDIAYHTACVARGTKRPLIVGDLPFGTYQLGPVRAYEAAWKLMAAGAHMVKLEGGAIMAETVSYIAQRGIPVMGHLGLTPQSEHSLGGFRVQGKDEEAANRIVEDAKSLEAAGIAAIVIEAVPASLGKAISDAVSVPTISIGAGPDCSGQILIIHDMLDIYPGHKAKFVKNYMKETGNVRDALAAFVKEVKSGAYPGPEHCF